MDTPEPTEAQEHKKKAVQRVGQDVCIYISLVGDLILYDVVEIFLPSKRQANSMEGE